jgi:putative membrane protein
MNARTLSLHHAIKAAIVLGFAMLIVYLVKSDNLTLFIAPRMAGYVKWSAVALYAVGIYELYLAVTTWWGRVSACDCDHPPSGSLFKNTTVYGLFVLPLLFGFLLPSTTMGSSMAAKKGMTLNAAASIRKDTQPAAAAAPAASAGQNPAAPAPGSSVASAPAADDSKLNELFKADKFTQAYADFGKKLYAMPEIDVQDSWYLETLNTVDLYIDNFIGRRMDLSGFVYRQDGMKDNQFVVGRFAVQCCSADAAPFGVLVEYDRAKTWANDTWVRVSGTLQKTTYEGQEIMMLKADQVTKLETPKDKQYVYPNPDFGL